MDHHHRSLAIANLKGLIAMRETEKQRLQAIIAYSRKSEERAQALAELALVVRGLKNDSELLARLESE
jgi:hypothetical protein